LAGDSLITRPWSHVREPAFLRLIDEIRAADVAIANLETVIHEFKGYAQADSGGTYMASPPQIAAELKWAGVDMLAHANNHSFDYGCSGILETIEYVRTAGITLAGSGKNLQDARAPGYFRCNGSTVALVAMAVDFVPYGKASYSRADLHGRPGLNPLTLVRERAIIVPTIIDHFPTVARHIGLKRGKQKGELTKLGLRIRSGTHFSLDWGERLRTDDLDGNLNSISLAADNADLVVVSVHAHRQGQWLNEFARRAIERGACAIFIHGPHRVRGIELYNGRPVFYSLGDFVYEPEHITRFPVEEYERLGLPPDANVTDLIKARTRATRGRKRFEGLGASISLSAGKITRVRLIPMDLQFDDKENRGRPQFASPYLGRKLVKRIAKQSREYGTRIQYDSETNCGEVVLD
jgi:poly-gamma-glutamate synthesis protein (capsule biosynthesis protein)